MRRLIIAAWAAGLALVTGAASFAANADSFRLTLSDGTTGTFEAPAAGGEITSFSLTFEGVTYQYPYDPPTNRYLPAFSIPLQIWQCAAPPVNVANVLCLTASGSPFVQRVVCSFDSVGGADCTGIQPEWTYTIAPIIATPATLQGFYPPVDPPSYATNLAKAGQTIPLKFYASTAAGPITNLTEVELHITNVACDALDEGVDPIESYSTISGGALQNQGGGSYQYNWKTIKGQTGCKMVTLSLPDEYEADSLVANFRFRK